MKTLEADVKKAFDWTKWAKSGPAVELEISIIREMLKVSLFPGVISFGGGLPASELFPTEELAAACLAVLKKHPADSLQYSLSMGVPLMREFLAARVSANDHPTQADNIFVTGGSQQGLDLIGRLFLEKGSPLCRLCCVRGWSLSPALSPRSPGSTPLLHRYLETVWLIRGCKTFVC